MRKLQIAISRHQTDVSQVAATSTAQMHLGKTDNLLATLMIAGTPVPTRLNLCRTGIHHTKRHVGTHENMAVIACTDDGIDVLCKVFSLCRNSKHQAEKEKFTFHRYSLFIVENLAQRYEKETKGPSHPA